jgi:hypothetical protein
MPVHFKVADHPATTVPKPNLIVQSPDELLHHTWGIRAKTERNVELLQSSFVDQDFSSVQPMMNGFVDSIRRAYSNHHCLIIRQVFFILHESAAYLWIILLGLMFGSPSWGSSISSSSYLHCIYLSYH